MTIKGNSIAQHVIWIKNGIIKHVNGYSWNPSTCICENGNCLKSIVNTSVAESDEIIIVMDIESTKKANTIKAKKTNTITTNVTSIASINCHSKNVRDYHSLHAVSLVIILLLIIIIICYYCPKQKGIMQNGK